MPIHDWTLVEPGIFHHFHLKWIAELDNALNGGILPPNYYCLAEQHSGYSIPDLLTLHAGPVPGEPLRLRDVGGIALADAPPKVERKRSGRASAAARRRTLAVRHVSEHRLVAILETISQANKDRADSVANFARKVASALDHGVNVLIIDLLPPGPNDAKGMHGSIWQHLESTEETYDLPPGLPRTLASYVASDPVDMYLEHPTVGSPLHDMPLFLDPGHYVNVPLEKTYQEAYRRMPAFWRDVLENKQ